MRAVATWGKRFWGARNVVALLVFAAVYLLRSRGSWRRWQRRRPAHERVMKGAEG